LEQRSRLSQHPIDVAIRRIVAGEQVATGTDIEQIIERMASVPFIPDLVSVPRTLRRISVAELGARDIVPSLTLHLVRRIAEKQWTSNANEVTYLADLRRGIRHRSARLAVYNRRGGTIALSVSQTNDVLANEARGVESLPMFAVVYSADRGMIITGYQASSLEAITIPEDARWLK
jgi:hypothetical protein